MSTSCTASASNRFDVSVMAPRAFRNCSFVSAAVSAIDRSKMAAKSATEVELPEDVNRTGVNRS